MTTLLASRIGRHDNNFNVMRLAAALAVLVSHSFALVKGGGHDQEPLRLWLGHSLGSVAVDVFFVISGFLVTESLLRRHSLKAFAIARARRIFPALIVAVLFCTLVVGPWFTTLPLRAYLSDPQTWIFLAKNSLAVAGYHPGLPGVFQSQPLSEAVDGSLWTLKYELRLYLALGVIAWLVGGVAREAGVRRFARAVFAMACCAGIVHLVRLLPDTHGNQWMRLTWMFFAGSGLRMLAHRVVLDRRLTMALILLLGAASVAGPAVFLRAYAVALPLLVLLLAYVDGRVLARLRPTSDYSYGVYIYAWPVQQSVIALWPDIDAIRLLFAAGAVTLVLAALSWHLIEAPVLRSRPHRPAGG